MHMYCSSPAFPLALIRQPNRPHCSAQRDGALRDDGLPRGAQTKHVMM